MRRIQGLPRAPKFILRWVAVLLLVFGALSATACAAASSEASTEGDTAVEPTPSYTPLMSDEELTERFSIPADLTGEELAKAYLERESAWVMYGSDSEEAAQAIDLGGQTKMREHWKGLAAQAAPIIGAAIFTEKLIANEQYYVQSIEQTNGAAIGLRFYTSDNTTGENPEPYARSAELTEFISSDIGEDGSETIQFTATTIENRDKNRADEITDGEDLNGLVRELTMTFVTENGMKKLDEISGQVTR